MDVPEKLEYSTEFLAFPVLPHQTFMAQLPFDTRKKKQNNTLPSKDDTPLVQRFVTKNFNKEESSWCDVSEMSTTSGTAYASGDSFRNEMHDRKSMLLDELTVSKMVELIKRLQKENQDIYKRVLEEGTNVYEKVLEQEGDNSNNNFRLIKKKKTWQYCFGFRTRNK